MIRHLVFSLLAGVSTLQAQPPTGSGGAFFHDAATYSDSTSVFLTGASIPPTGTGYFAWLGADDDQTYLLLGELPVGGGNALLQYVHPSGLNLIGAYKKIVITQENTPFSGTTPTLDATVFADSLYGPGAPGAGSMLRYLRNALSSFSTAENRGLKVWCKRYITTHHSGIVGHATFARDAAALNDVAGARVHSDHVYDFIVGHLTGLITGNTSEAQNGDPVRYGYLRYGELDTMYSTQGGAGHYLALAIAQPDARPHHIAAGNSALTALRNAFGTDNQSGWASEVTTQALDIIQGNYGSLAVAGAELLARTQRFIYGTVGPAVTAAATGGIWAAYYHAQRTASFRFPGPVTSTPDILPSSVPSAVVLHQNYPNPFNPSTAIRFDIPFHSLVTISLYNVIGQMVAMIVDEQEYSPGSHRVVFEANLPTGVYMYELRGRHLDEGRAFRVARRMMVLR